MTSLLYLAEALNDLKLFLRCLISQQNHQKVFSKLIREPILTFRGRLSDIFYNKYHRLHNHMLCHDGHRKP